MLTPPEPACLPCPLCRRPVATVERLAVTVLGHALQVFGCADCLAPYRDDLAPVHR